MRKAEKGETGGKTPLQRPPFLTVLKKSGTSFLAMTPMLLGIIGLVGLFQTLVTPQMLASLFGGNPMIDSLTGMLAGAVAVGTPIVSYVLGGELLAQGISLFAVTAFILSWVTLGFLQLPAEVDAFGWRFTVRRNLLAVVFTLLVSALTPLTVQVLS
jgi:uncharacterized membrane protein YraQ (UPF0718 family)